MFHNNSKIFFICITMLFLTQFLQYYWRLKINITSSMPRGIYQQIASNKFNNFRSGDIVAVCLPKELIQFGLKHHFLHYGGECWHETLPILKQIIATPNDHISWNSNYLSVNNEYYFMPKTCHFCKTQSNFTNKGYILYGANDNLHSWDSRYFGAVKSNNIIAKYRLIFSL